MPHPPEADELIANTMVVNKIHMNIFQLNHNHNTISFIHKFNFTDVFGHQSTTSQLAQEHVLELIQI